MGDQINTVRPLVNSVDPDDEPGERRGETPITRAIRAWYTLVIQVSVVSLVAVSLILFVDGVFVASEGDQSLDPSRQPKLVASDITTAVSVALVIVRLVTGSWAAITAWRCVYILLEKDSLTLSQVNFMVSYKIPSAISGRYSWLVVVILFLLLPAQFAAPLASGAVGWRNVEILLGDYSVTTPAVDYPDGTVQSWWWGTYFDNLPTRQNIVTLALRKSFELYTETEHTNGTGCRRLVESNLSVGSTVSDTPIPCLVVHSIEWDTTIPPKNVTDLLWRPPNTVLFDPELVASNTTNSSIPENPILGDNPGNIAILGLPVWTTKGRSGLLNSSTTFSGSWRIACMYAHSPCNPAPLHLESMNTTNPITPYEVQQGSGNCYIFGTINFTAGVTKSKSRFVAHNVLEADYDSNLQIEANALTEQSIYLMNDLFVAMNIASQFITPWGLMDTYSGAVERFFRRSFIAIWHGIQGELRYGWENADRDRNPVLGLGSPPNHVSEAKMWVMRLQAIVSRKRVIGWLVANLLMTLSGVILAVIQSHCSRPVVIDHAAAAITADVQELLEKDRNGLSKLSYVTKEDTKLGKLALISQERGGGLQFMIVPKGGE